jgi:hypothetical protein
MIPKSVQRFSEKIMLKHGAKGGASAPVPHFINLAAIRR